MPKLSIIIPAFNEEKRLPATLRAACSFFTDRKADFEIIVVNDGSTDNTAAIVKEFAGQYAQIRLLNNAVNRGKGYSLKTGVLAAAGDYILIDDADGSSPIEEFERLYIAIEKGADLAIGSRAKPDPSRKVNALPYRTYIGNTFNRIVQGLLLPGIYDTQCGFKLFKKSVAHDLFSQSEVAGYAFDVEILYLAKLHGYRIEEVSINWNNVAGSKVNVIIDSMKMLLEVLKIYYRGSQGKYLKTKTQQSNE